MKANIKCITITGADDSTDIKEIEKISNEYPLVEWGILLSKSQIGTPRFPSKEKLNEFVNDLCPCVSLSAHLCGSWVRRLLLGKEEVINELPDFLHAVHRIQLNFHAEKLLVNPEEFVKCLFLLEDKFGIKKWIFQSDTINESFARIASTYIRHEDEEEVLERNETNSLDITYLIDSSHGAGVTPALWPKANNYILHNEYVGYAGGLGIDNIEQQLELIAEASGDTPIWIDSEGKFRAIENNKDILDLDKVKIYLEKVYNYLED